MSTTHKASAEDQAASHDIDRYPNAVTAMRRIIQDAELPEGPVERIEVTFLASGEATYRVWQARAEESEGGYLPPA